MDRVAESRQPIWIIPGPLVIWGVHFLLCYFTAALWCGKFAGPLAPLGSARLAIGVYTAIALAAIGVIARIAYRARTFGDARPPFDDDSPQDRHRFVGYASLLIAGLSAIAVVYSALPAAFLETCE